MKNKFFKTSFATIFLATSLAVAGCSGTATEAAQPATQAQGVVAPVAVQTHGQVKMFGEALSQVPLRPEQRTEIEQLASDAEVRHEASRKAHQDLMLAVADQIEHGAIDRTALQPKIDAAVSAAEQSRPADRAALQRLHGILDGTQREAFVNALKDKMHAEHGQHGHHDQAAKAAADGDQPEHEHALGHMKQLADDLKLTDDQRSQIKDIMKAEFQKNGGKGIHDMMKARDHAHDVMEQFKGESFQVDQVMPTVDIRVKVKDGQEHIIGVAEKVLPILTAEQRTLAAQKIREHAASGKQMMPF